MPRLPRALWIAAWLLLVLASEATMLGESVPFALDLRTVDATTGREIREVSALVQTGQRFLECHKGDVVHLACLGELEPSERLEVELSPTGPYAGRQISFFVSPIQSEVRRADAIGLAPAGSSPSFRSIGPIVKYLESRATIDRALSLSERYYDVELSPGLIELRATVHYNYAASLQNACRLLDYDTCDRALELFEELKAWKARERTTFDRFDSKISDAQIQRAIADIHSYVLQRRTNSVLNAYEQATKEFNRRDAGVCRAVVQYERIANAFDRERGIWEANGLWEWKLLFDLATARLRCALVSERSGELAPAEVCSEIQASLDRLEDVEALLTLDRGEESERALERARISTALVKDREFGRTLMRQQECGGLVGGPQ